MTVNEALTAAIQALRAADVPDAANDARILMAHALGIDRGRLTLVLPDEVGNDVMIRFSMAIDERCARKPVSHIIGTREFFSRDFIVTADVLDPRPETELLVETALAAPFETVLDLGTGSGCILLSLLAENGSATGQGSDTSPAALNIAEQNATRLGLEKRTSFIRSDWFDNIDGRFDLIVSNPPYIAADEMPALSPEVRNWEPLIALTPGGDGLDAYRVITANAAQHLNPQGRLLVEIGPTQAGAVSSLFEDAGFDGITTLQDIDGRDRVVIGVLT
ncbi:peptide chain release factor N(5)-glutamine methyltransferase [Profundibacter amoris]|uniref:Release factor glutamine methyltransferase n=1 Tax=Profundibacter amoris TaxID=2171755 RepID=A0A347UGZ9_9RHOB|nr:peptide chain release factor N(5)-glutamine methyltransferase [Profundibacter amoris]AXX98127.1 peptide chain release factor N(5)-glutamine methyltransferase [Profundibacter amoris]